MLNGKSATLTEIHDELSRYNVSPTGFNVIMQGDVTGIVSMSATERRKIIDELAGTAEFDRRIDQANEELTAVGDKVENQKIIMAEIAVRLEQLRADRDQALKYLDLKTQKESVEKALVFVKAQEMELKVKGEHAELARLNTREAELGTLLEQVEIRLLCLRSEIGRVDNEIRDKGGNEQLLLRQQLDTRRGELTREENKLSNLMGVIGEKGKALKTVAAQLKAIDKRINDLLRGRKQHLEDQQQVKLRLMECQGAFSAVMAEIEVMRQEKDRSSDKVGRSPP